MESIFANPLEELIEFGDMNRELERGQGPLLVSGCMDSQKAHLISELTKEIPWKLIVTYDDQRARELYEDYRCFSPDVYLYPARDRVTEEVYKRNGNAYAALAPYDS